MVTLRAVVNHSMSKWRAVMSATPHGLGPALFNIFVGDMDSGIEAPSASSLMTPSCVVQSTGWREGMLSKGTLAGLRGVPVQTS